MIRHFCDLCDSEVLSTQLTTLCLVQIEEQDIRTYNRFDIHKYTKRVQHEICIGCRIQILDKVAALKVKEVKG